MPRTTVARKYGKTSKMSTAERLFAELPQTPIRKPAPPVVDDDDAVSCLADKLSTVKIDQEEEKQEKREKEEQKPRRTSPRKSRAPRRVDVDVREDLVEAVEAREVSVPLEDALAKISLEEVESDKDHEKVQKAEEEAQQVESREETEQDQVTSEHTSDTSTLRALTWDDVCPPEDRIEKIAEASYAEVYRVTNERGTSIIKVIRLPSPIKPQTKAQIKARLVDEEERSEEDVSGELQISEWLADIPGFVVYKERYVIQGKTTKGLLETHQAFQRRMKRKDPGRAQFYPSPSRYLEDTKFLVVELGDAGKALEDWELDSVDQLWDIFFLEALALARAEDIAMFEHRDLHEGNLCIKQVTPPKERSATSTGFFGYSGLDITILDYGLSRAEDLSIDYAKPVAFDLERELGLFTSTHAPQCQVYRQMRSFLLRADRKCLPPEEHSIPYAKGIDGPLSWDAYAPYTNVLWLAYLYEYLVDNFQGDEKALAQFKEQTRELWAYLNPEAGDDVPCFGCSADVVCFAVEAGWINEDQLLGPGDSSILDRGEHSIIVSRDDAYAEDGWDASARRRSPRRRRA